MRLIDKLIFYFSSHVKTMIFLVTFIFALGILFFSVDNFNNKSRQKLMENAFNLGNARIIKIDPINRISMDFDGNNIYTIGKKITFKFEKDSNIVSSTDKLFFNDLNPKQYRSLINFKVGDSILYGETKNLKKIIILK
jgi:hypothetical protein